MLLDIVNPIFMSCTVRAPRPSEVTCVSEFCSSKFVDAPIRWCITGIDEVTTALLQFTQSVRCQLSYRYMAWWHRRWLLTLILSPNTLHDSLEPGLHKPNGDGLNLSNVVAENTRDSIVHQFVEQLTRTRQNKDRTAVLHFRMEPRFVSRYQVSKFPVRRKGPTLKGHVEYDKWCTNLLGGFLPESRM